MGRRQISDGTLDNEQNHNYRTDGDSYRNFKHFCVFHFWGTQFPSIMQDLGGNVARI
jgi:hypothetical protein